MHRHKHLHTTELYKRFLFNGLKTKIMNIDNLITQYEQRVKNLHNSLRMAKGVAKARVSDKLYCANKTLDELNTLRLYVVSQQRELLIDCLDQTSMLDNYKFRTSEDKVDEFLRSINCG